MDPLNVVDRRYVIELCDEVMETLRARKPVVVLTAISPRRLRHIVEAMAPRLVKIGARVIRIDNPEAISIDMRALCRAVLASDDYLDMDDPAERFFTILRRRRGQESRVVLLIEDADYIAHDSLVYLEQIMAAGDAANVPLQVLLVGSPAIWDKLPASGVFAAESIMALPDGAAGDDEATPGYSAGLTPERTGYGIDLEAGQTEPLDTAPPLRAGQIIVGGALLVVSVACGFVLLKSPRLGESVHAVASAETPPRPGPAMPVYAAVAHAPNPSQIVAVPMPDTVPETVKPAPPPSPVAEAVPPPAPSPAEAAEVEGLLARGDSLIGLGDIATARLVYERAAMLHSARAATSVGKTYDARFLASIGAQGVVPDPVAAASWYRRGAALGDTQAEALLTESGDTASR